MHACILSVRSSFFQCPCAHTKAALCIIAVFSALQQPLINWKTDRRCNCRTDCAWLCGRGMGAQDTHVRDFEAPWARNNNKVNTKPMVLTASSLCHPAELRWIAAKDNAGRTRLLQRLCDTCNTY